jgi:hypothetical protein
MMAGSRNSAGVNDYAQLYRTVEGVRWGWHYVPAKVGLYRAKGLRVRRYRIDGAPALFVHPDDYDAVEAAYSTETEKKP